MTPLQKNHSLPEANLVGKQGVRLVHTQYPQRGKQDPNQLIEMVFVATDEDGDDKEITVSINVTDLFCRTKEGQEWLRRQAEATGPQSMKRTG